MTGARARYVIAVEHVDWMAVRHAIPRPTGPLQSLERGPSMCGAAQVFPLLVMGATMLEFLGEDGTCQACRAAITAAAENRGGGDA